MNIEKNIPLPTSIKSETKSSPAYKMYKEMGLNDSVFFKNEEGAKKILQIVKNIKGRFYTKKQFCYKAQTAGIRFWRVSVDDPKKS